MTVEMLMVEEKQAGIKIGLEQGLEQGRKAGVEEGLVQGLVQKANETAKNLKNANIDINIISQCTGLSTEEIEKL